MQSRSTRAFTRAELLVVAVIVLAVVLSFSDAVSNAKYNSRAAQCRANLKQVGLAAQSYHASHAGKLPPTLKTLLPIVKSQSPFICPDTSRTGLYPNSIEVGYDYRFLSKPRGTEVIAWDSQPHHPQHSVLFFLNHANRNVLLADGQVLNMHEVQFRQLHLQGQTWIIETRP